MTDEPHATVGLNDLLAKVDSVEKAAIRIEARLDMVTDHETRIRALEKKLWGFAAVATGLGALLSQVIPSINIGG